MSKTYIWQRTKWPHFIWDNDRIITDLSQARQWQGKILAQAYEIGLEAQAQFFIDDAETTSAIEGEKLDPRSIRSSVAKRLGLSAAGLPTPQRNVDGLVAMLLDATQNYAQPLTDLRLKGWQAGLFPTGFSNINKIIVGDWRRSKEPMQVVSGPMEKGKIHFEAPPSNQVPKEMKLFLKWFNSKNEIDGIIRAAISHLWFVTIHPFDDGNGRLARAITDLALAQDESSGKRYYSLSSQISLDRKDYYRQLEQSQKGDVDITNWIVWFLKTFVRALEKSQKSIDKAMLIGNFWKKYAKLDLSIRQKKVLQKMLESEPGGFVGGMTNRKYVGIAKVSPASAKRDLADLEKKGLIKRNKSKGRSVSYCLIKK